MVYNHYYPSNISVVDGLYGSRFSSVFHLLPFAREESQFVRSVGRSSHHFNGFIYDARESLAAVDCDRYLFIADDVFLNPAVSEENLSDLFGLSRSDDSFLHQFDPFTNLESYWAHAAGALQFTLNSEPLDLRHVLPDFEAAKRRLTSHDAYSDSVPEAAMNRSSKHRALRRLSKAIDDVEATLWGLAGVPGPSRRQPKTNRLSYPLAYGYSDIAVVAKKNFLEFAEYCGAFAAANLFVEIALPTALALASETIRTQSGSPLEGRPLWGTGTNILDRFDKSMARLLEEFPEDWLFVHPVKLSGWE